MSQIDSPSKGNGPVFFKVWIVSLCEVMPLLNGHYEIL